MKHPVKVKKLLTPNWKHLKHPIKSKNLLVLGNYRWAVRQKLLELNRKRVNHPVKAKKTTFTYFETRETPSKR